MQNRSWVFPFQKLQKIVCCCYCCIVIPGRPIAIDWAIPKQQYASQVTPGELKVEGAGIESESGAEKEPGGAQSGNEEHADVDEEFKDSSGESDAGSDEEDESDVDESDNEGSSVDDGDVSQRKKVGEKDGKWKGANTDVERESDVGEGKTVFIRNLDFTTTEDALKNFMEQFGSVHYALLCMDKVMERPKGTGFIKFRVIFLKDLFHFQN